MNSSADSSSTWLPKPAMIYFFAYFWTTVQFQPKEMANQLRDYGSFIPGLRPGKRTAITWKRS